MLERFSGWLRSLGRPWEVACFGALPGIALGYALWWVIREPLRLEDFGIFRAAAAAVVHGRSPYPAADPLALAHFDKFVYPPLSAVAFVPLAELPVAAAQVVMLMLGLGASVLALRLLDVRDWRCYGVALMSAPLVNSLVLGALTSFLMLGAAAAWRYRDRARAAGWAAAATAVVKLFLWPLGVWLVATRRLRTVRIFVFASVALGLGGWVVIGFAGLRSYPHLLRVLAEVEAGKGYGLVALLHLDAGAAEAFSFGAAATVAVAVVLAARGEGGDRRAFAVAVVGAVAATPLLWLHYLALLFVPIALYRPRLSGLWCLPLVLWFTPATQPRGDELRIALALVVVATVLVAVVSEQRLRLPTTVASARRVDRAELSS